MTPRRFSHLVVLCGCLPGVPAATTATSVFWPNGIHAQALTEGPPPGEAMITIKRADGVKFETAHCTLQSNAEDYRRLFPATRCDPNQPGGSQPL
jgi:hypothetical protein